MGRKLYVLNEDGTTDAAGTGSYVKGHSVVLRTSAWSNLKQTVSVSDVISDADECHVSVSPAPSSFDAYGDAGVRCTAQGNGTLTFESTSAPSENLTINILVMR